MESLETSNASLRKDLDDLREKLRKVLLLCLLVPLEEVLPTHLGEPISIFTGRFGGFSPKRWWRCFRE